jgi:hypothetical protein
MGYENTVLYHEPGVEASCVMPKVVHEPWGENRAALPLRLLLYVAVSQHPLHQTVPLWFFPR